MSSQVDVTSDAAVVLNHLLASSTGFLEEVFLTEIKELGVTHPGVAFGELVSLGLAKIQVDEDSGSGTKNKRYKPTRRAFEVSVNIV